MAEEFENYEDRMAEARRAVERWEAEGGAQEDEEPEGCPVHAPPGEAERDAPPEQSGDGSAPSRRRQ
jgi:hypothetical protein